MPFSTAQRLEQLSVPTPLAIELGRQLDTGVYNVFRLIEMGMDSGLAKVVVTQPFDKVKATRLGMIPAVAAYITNRSSAPYLGFTANGLLFPNNYASAFKYLNAVKAHYARDTIVNPRIILGNARTNSAGAPDTGPGGPVTHAASFIYGGQPYQALFGGNALGVVADLGLLISDPVMGLTIPAGTLFFTRVFADAPSGFVYYSGTNARSRTSLGERFEFSATTLPNRTMDGSAVVSTSGATLMYGPVGIVSMTQKPSYVAYGDSIAWGERETVDDSLDMGVVSRALGPNYGGISMGVSGDDTGEFIMSTKAARLALAQYASDVVWEFGTNDLRAGRTTAQITADRNTAKAQVIAGKRHHVTSITPDTFQASWNNAAQVKGVTEPERLLLNAANRAVPSGYLTCLEIADTQETDTSGSTVTVRNGGIWKNNYSGDGLHPLLLGGAAIGAVANTFSLPAL